MNFIICSEERAFVSDKMMKTENQSGATCCGLWYLSCDVSTGRFTNSTIEGSHVGITSSSVLAWALQAEEQQQGIRAIFYATKGHIGTQC